MRPSIPVLSVLTALSAGCVTAPQTRAEFVKVVRAGTRYSKYEVIPVTRSLNDITERLRKRADECLSKTIERTANVGYVEHSSSTYVPSMEKLGERSEFTLRVQHRPRGVGSPPDGVFLLAVDMASEGKRATKAELFSPTIGFTHIGDAVRSWLKGENAPCPELK
jgi:hypothetical protein